MGTQIVYSQEYAKHNDASHPENARRLFSIIDEIKKTSFYNELEFVKPKMLLENSLYDVHSDWMIEQIKDMSMDDIAWIDMDTYVCNQDYETAKLASGGLVQVCNNVMKGEADNAYALIRPPGHHATKDKSMGFCLFNNAAIAANELAKQGKKVLIFDHDVHHGNGTQDILYNRKEILYQSFHLYPHYPGTGSVNEIGSGDGEGYTINAPLSHGNGDEAVFEVLDEIFLPIAKQFKPDLIIFSSGFDSHHFDPLGGLQLTVDTFGELIAKYQEIQPKIVCTLEGGYNFDWIGKCVVSQLGQMTGNKIKIEDTAFENKNVEDVINRIKKELENFWKI